MYGKFKTKKQFIVTLLTHKFNNDVLDFTFSQQQTSYCKVIIENKITHEIHIGRFGSFIQEKKIIGCLKVRDRRFLTNTNDGKIGNPDTIIEGADNFISYLENILIGIS
jgi:hypothetical protein